MNVRESFLMADRLALAGYLPFPPLYSHFWHFLCPHEYAFWTKLDLEWVPKCDRLLRMPGESRGADQEVEFAKTHGIPVYYSFDELKNENPVTDNENHYQSIDKPLKKL